MFLGRETYQNAKNLLVMDPGLQMLISCWKLLRTVLNLERMLFWGLLNLALDMIEAATQIALKQRRLMEKYKTKSML